MRKSTGLTVILAAVLLGSAAIASGPVFALPNPLPSDYTEGQMAPRREIYDPCIVRDGDLHRLVFTPWLIGITLPDRFTPDKGLPSRRLPPVDCSDKYAEKPHFRFPMRGRSSRPCTSMYSDLLRAVILLPAAVATLLPPGIGAPAERLTDRFKDPPVEFRSRPLYWLNAPLDPAVELRVPDGTLMAAVAMETRTKQRLDLAGSIKDIPCVDIDEGPKPFRTKSNPNGKGGKAYFAERPTAGTLEAILDGAMVFDASGTGPMPHGATFMSPEWRENFKHALREADRLGLEVSFNLCSGWDAGGPWITYRTDGIGTLRFERIGSHALAVKPKTPPAWKVIGLKSVVLTPRVAGTAPSSEESRSRKEP